jgi:hypothetical protein
MSTSSHPKIRRLLHQYSDGLTTQDIAERTGIKYDTVRMALHNMPDVYIDRWTEAKMQAPSEAVHCAVVPPEDCPRPNRKG